MKTYPFYLFIFSFFFVVHIAEAQQLEQQLDKVYNIDPQLYNGKIFTDFYIGGFGGTQFFSGAEFQFGDLGLSNKVYKQQGLNYEVYQQKLLLSFKDKIKAEIIIEIPIEHIRFFYLKNTYFEVISWPDNSYKIFQVFGNDKNKIMIHWRRYLKSNSNAIANQRQFSELKKQIWVLKQGEYYSINNNKSFINLFDLDQQDAIKKWLKTNQIKLRNANDEKLQSLADYWILKW